MIVKDEYIQCRVLSHSWEFYDVISNCGRRHAYYMQEMICTRCGATKTWFLSRSGDIVSTSYKYPSDYRIPGGLDKSDRSKARRRLISRVPRVHRG